MTKKEKTMKEKNWTLKDIPDLTGKIMLVTGGNSGLGFESVKAFALKNAEVILACRSVEKGEKAKADIIRNHPQVNIKVMQLDLGDLASVKSFAAAIKQNYTKIDVLLNNAGIMMPPYFTTKDGFEGQFGTNHLGHFALTGQLLDLLPNTPGSRVVNVSSAAHRIGEMNFDNLQFEHGGYKKMKAYGRSKLANLLFTYELQRKLEAARKNTIAVAAHPGVAATNLGRGDFVGEFLFKILSPIVRLLTQGPAEGALSQIRASVDPDVEGGQYYGPNGRNERNGYPVVVQSNEASHNLTVAARLWEESEKLTGVKYTF
jgi:NAD(P)-dependent dehydrogenase (short-subunit alcohol dehydrogenase family)